MSFELISLENIQEIAHNYGYLAIFLGILLENLGIPLPGEQGHRRGGAHAQRGVVLPVGGSKEVHQPGGELHPHGASLRV